MAYKVFSNGSVLNASEMNEYLMNQSVITFSNSTARGSAITTPVEGMITYLEDTQTYESWDGAAWTNLVSAGGSGNVLINGAFEINQRGYVSAANLASGDYGFDRWKSTFTNTTLTFTPAPQGQEVTINSGGSIEQVVERANVPAGTYTLSWTGTATGRVYNTGATPPSYAASPITVTLDGLANVEVEFTASGETKTLSKVQLEAGSSATPFFRNGTTLQGEISACQRYFYAVAGPGGTGLINGGYYSSTSFYGIIRPPVTMRSAPTVTSTPTDFAVYSGNTSRAVTSISVNNSMSEAISLQLVTSSATQGNSGWSESTDPAAYVRFDSEL
jgi:hypothetical protein